MSKLDINVLNNIKMLSLDMIREAGSGNSGVSLSMPNIFYNLFLNHLKFQKNNPNWINRDRVIVNNNYLPVMYSTLHMFGYDISLETLKEYKKLNSISSGYANPNTPGIEIGSITNGDVIASSVGIALGERYLNSLIKLEKPKCELINYHTYCICTMDDIMSGLGYEALSFASKEQLNKLIILCNKDDIGRDSSSKEIYTENIMDRFDALNFEVIEVKNGHNFSAIDVAIDEAKENKKPTVIIFSTKYAKDSTRECSNELYNLPLTNDDINDLCEKYKIIMPITDTQEYRLELEKIVNKRLSKTIDKWNELKSECINDLKIKEIIEFVESKNIKIDFSSDNFKLNDTYNEELINGNSKMFNMFALKSPFILSCSNDNFIYTKCNITKSGIMSNKNKVGRNILFGGRTSAMGGIANGLASLGFKVFISTPLIQSSTLLNGIKLSTMFNYPVNYVFTQDTFTNTYENMGISSVFEINILRIIPNLITIRPCDINEIIGTYEILSNYKKSIAMIIGSEKTPKFIGTNPKYVVAGAYRVRREKGELNGTIIATGSEVALAIDIAEELYSSYQIDLRVVTMPSKELFEKQNDRYRYSLIPKEFKTFVIEFGSSMLWSNFATGEEYIFGVSNYTPCGTKLELLKKYNLTKDNIKAKIIELIKN